MTNLIFVFFGAGIGGIARFLFGKFAIQNFGDALPFGTFGVNAIGGLLIGFAAALLAKHSHNHHFIQYFIIIGFLGGFTTFSSFSLETVRLIEHQRLLEAFGYILASVIASIGAVFIGMAVGRHIV